MAVAERLIRALDKPRAEVVIEVQILEVNRNRAKSFGINLSDYALGLTFSPEVAPPNTSGTIPPTAPPPFNLNTISQGISTSDFYLTVPTAFLRFLETDSRTKQLAKPQLRGAEGQELTLNLGDQIPVVSTVFGAAAAGGFANIPQSSFTYRDVGVNITMTPRVTYEGEIILDLTVESSNLGPNISVAGQDVPSFGSRRVKTRLRLREGESNLLAGLLKDDQRKIISGMVGLVRVPGLRSLFGSTSDEISQTDIVMLLTPHIVRTHELTVDDLAPMYIGTQQNVGLTGPPPLIQPPAAEDPAAAQVPVQPPGPITTTTPQFLPPPGGTPVPATAVPPPGATVPPVTPTAPPTVPPAVTTPPPPVGALPPTATGVPGAPGAVPPRDPAVPSPDTPGASARPRGTDHRDGAAGVPDRGRALHGAGRRSERVAPVDDYADGDVQPRRPARAQRAGGDVHAPGRRHRQLHAPYRRGDRTRGHCRVAHRRSGRRVRFGAARGAALRCRRPRQLAHPGERRRQQSRRWGGAVALRTGVGDGEVTR